MTPYEHDLTREVEQFLFFNPGMHVELYNAGAFGKILAHRGFQYRIMQHCYDVLLDSGEVKFKVCESDMVRYVGACLGVVK